MANHVTIRMVLSGKCSAIREFYCSHIVKEGGEKRFDFNTLIPMPTALDITSRYPETDTMKANKEKFGFFSWYDWRIENWGTKWNSHENSIKLENPIDEGIGRLTVGFQTAWSLPDKVVNEIIDLYPELEINLQCVEEGGFFGGYIKYVPGEEVVTDLREDLWDEYARKLYGEDWWNEYNSDMNDEQTAV